MTIDQEQKLYNKLVDLPDNLYILRKLLQGKVVTLKSQKELIDQSSKTYSYDNGIFEYGGDGRVKEWGPNTVQAQIQEISPQTRYSQNIIQIRAVFAEKLYNKSTEYPKPRFIGYNYNMRLSEFHVGNLLAGYDPELSDSGICSSNLLLLFT